jgi:hypothetical protein
LQRKNSIALQLFYGNERNFYKKQPSKNTSAGMKTHLIEKKHGSSSSDSVTLRFKTDVLSKLKHEAAQKRISLNTLSAQILESHVEYGSYASTSGMVSFPKTLLVRMMDGLSDTEVEKLSEHIAKNEIKDLTLLLRGEHNLSSFLKTIESWLRVSNFQYSYYVSDDDRSHRFVIQHEMGRRWSLYFERLFKYVFSGLPSVRRPEFEITDNVLTFRVEE